MKLKQRKCIPVGNSKGFITPSEKLAVGKYYDLTISEPKGEPKEEVPEVEK